MDQFRKVWWHYLLAIPPNKEAVGFKRIERLIKDKTRYGRNQKGRLHEFYNTNHETNLTVSLWENFSIFENFDWINTLTKFTQAPILEEVTACNWSYEWEKKTKNGIKLCDIVIEFQTIKLKGIIVVESKNLGKTLSKKDNDINYYLGIDDFVDYEKKYLIYCVDENVCQEVQKMIMADSGNYGILTWQDLGGIQMESINRLNLKSELKTFLKATIYNQFKSRGILPNFPIEDYLVNEPPMEEYVEMKCDSKDMQKKIWRIK